MPLVRYTCRVCGEPKTEDRIASPVNPYECPACYGRRTGVKPVIVEPTPATIAPTSTNDDLAASLEPEREEMVALAAELQSFTPDSPEALAQFGEWLVDIKARAARTKERLEEITKPFNQALKSVRDLFRPTLDAYDQAERLLKSAIAEGQKALAAQNRAAIDSASGALARGEAPPALVSAALPEGVSTRKVWDYEVVDANLIPREYLEIDSKKVLAAVRAGISVPGVRGFQKDTIVASAKKGGT